MEIILPIVTILSLAINLPLAIAFCWGMKLYTDSTCPEDIKDVRRSKLALKCALIFNAITALALLILLGI